MKTTLSIFLLLIIATAWFVGCNNDDQVPVPDTAEKPARPKVRLQLNWKPEPQFGGFYAASRIGAYASHGIDVEIVPGGSGTPAVQMVEAGNTEFGIASGDDIVIARARGADIVALFAVYQTCPQGIMVHAARGFKDIGDVFKNSGTLAMERGRPYADFLEKKYAPVKAEIVPYTGGISSFLADSNFSQQCFVTSEPILARHEHSDPQTFLIADAGYNPYTTVLVTSGKYLRDNRQKVQAMVQSVRAGWQSYLHDPVPANAMMVELNKGMSAQMMSESALAQAPLIETGVLGSMAKERWATLGEQLAGLGVIKQAPPAEECFAVVEPAR